MDVSNVSRIEVIDHTLPLEKGGGRAYVKWEEKFDVELYLQDDKRTLKIIIK